MGLNIKRTIAKLKGEESTVSSEPITHDLSLRIWGTNYDVMERSDDGEMLRLSVWNPHPVGVGDYLLLQGGGEGGKTRYLVDTVERCHDPGDMYFVEVIFAPRQESAQ